MGCPDDERNLGEDDDHMKKTVVEDYEKKMELFNEPVVDLLDDEKIGVTGFTDLSGGDVQMDSTQVQEISEGGSSSTLNISDDSDVEEIYDSENQEGVSDSDEAGEEKLFVISDSDASGLDLHGDEKIGVTGSEPTEVQEITEAISSSSLKISQDKGEEVYDSGNREDGVQFPKFDEAGEEKKSEMSDESGLDSHDDEKTRVTVSAELSGGDIPMESTEIRDISEVGDEVVDGKKLELSAQSGVDLEEDKKIGFKGLTDFSGGDIPIEPNEVQEISEGGSSPNTSEDKGEEKIYDPEDREDPVQKSDEAGEEKKLEISDESKLDLLRDDEIIGANVLIDLIRVRVITKGRSNGEEKIYDPEDREGDVPFPISDEAIKEIKIEIYDEPGDDEKSGITVLTDLRGSDIPKESIQVQEITSEDDGEEKINGPEDREDDVSNPKSDEAGEEEEIPSKLRDIGTKTATAGWFVDGGDSVLLAHDDGSCSLYDAANFKEKLQFESVSSDFMRDAFRDCWIVEASGPNQESKKYVVAASSGNRDQSGFCSWDFESRNVQSWHFLEVGKLKSALPVSPASTWWHSPSGSLVALTLTLDTKMSIYDVRDSRARGHLIVPEPVCPLHCTSPLQWRDKGRIVLAHPSCLSLWDAWSGGCIRSCEFGNEAIYALHVNNPESETGTGGVRQSMSTSDIVGVDAVVCTSRSIFVLDFRKKDGKGIRIPLDGLRPHSVYTSSRSIYVGCDYLASASNETFVKQYSQHKGEMVLGSFKIEPERRDGARTPAVRQVWGDTWRLAMGLCRSGVYVFGGDEGSGCGDDGDVKVQVVGSDDDGGGGSGVVVGRPSFDFCSGSGRVLLVNGRGPARWKRLDLG